MKKGLLILLIGIFIVGVVNGADSETKSEFTISGCDFGETGLANGSCSSKGDYFCSYKEGSFTLYDTIYDDTGCSYGSNTYTPGQPFCCPLGYFCENDVGGPSCSLREEDCSDQLTQNNCENIGCNWLLTDGGICIESPADYGCDIYQTSETCLEDKFRLGQIGVGTEICGTYFTANNIGYVIPFDSCRCEWDNSASLCNQTSNILEEFNNGPINSFKCTKGFDMGNCTEGIQLITWTATPQIISGYPLGIPLAVLADAKCIDNPGGTERACGTSTIKLPGFSLLSFLLSLGVVGLFYFLKELKNKND